MARDSASWSCESTAGHEHFDAVAVCNGHYTKPFAPELPGMSTFAGRLMHSHNYRAPEAFSQERIVLLGAKASGEDIAFELSLHAREVHLCGRGHPPYESRGPNVYLRPSIARLGRRHVELSDGACIEDVDTLMFCTGFLFSFEFLEAGLIDVELGYVSPLYRELLWLEDPSLAFIGLPLQVAPFRLFEVQANFVAALWSGGISIPNWDERRRWLAAHETEQAVAGRARRHWLRHGDRQFAYHDGLAADCGQPPLPRAFVDAYLASRAARRADPAGYRDDSGDESPPG